jgi:hypothetical protein
VDGALGQVGRRPGPAADGHGGGRWWVWVLMGMGRQKSSPNVSAHVGPVVPSSCIQLPSGIVILGWTDVTC